MADPKRSSNRRTLVLAGGSGFMGRHLADALAARGDQVVILSRSRYSDRAGVTYRRWDAKTVGD